MPDPKTVFIVSHTHWDREWYFPFHRFRVNLERVVDRLLELLEADPDFRHFVLDGQTAVLEDYLEVRPDSEGRIRDLVRERALSIGPWYILPDEFLVSGEATIRNLLIGHQVAGRFGRVQRVGYMPDSFGHIAQMPQILRKAGIDSFIYTRGNGDEIDETGCEFFWRAPDGSEVYATNQCGGYCNAGGLGFEELWHAHTRRHVDLDRAVEQIRDLFAKMEPVSNGDIRLLNNGCDHFPPQQQFGAILNRLREAFPATEFRHTGFEDYVDALKKAGFVRNRFQGEMRSGRLHPILSGVWSARIYLKQWNDRAQTLLTEYAEPLAAYTHFSSGRPYPQGTLEHAWKLLLKNHPHDSICGCSTDEVHREMVPRFEGVVQTCEQVLRNELEHLCPTFARQADGDRETVLCVANPLPEIRNEVVTRLIVLQPLNFDLGRMRLLDQSGRDVPFQIIDRRYLERFWGIDYRTELDDHRQQAQLQTYLDRFGDRIVKSESERDTADCFLTIQFAAENLPALGHANYYLTDRESKGKADPNPAAPRVTAQEDTAENEFYRVRLHRDGTFDLFDKRTGIDHQGLNRLEDTEDIGDEYDYSPAPESKTCQPGDVAAKTAGSLAVLADTGLSATLEAAFDLRLPASIEPSRARRSARKVECPTRVQINLEAGSPVLQVRLSFQNRAQDHRLRACFPTSIRSDVLVSDGHFYLNHRPIEPALKDGAADWVQPPLGTVPRQDFSLVEDATGGVAVLNRGLPEIEAKTDASGHVSLYLTLLRAVGWLSRDDFETRRFTNAGPTIHTPEAQCLGEHTFEYAVATFAGDHLRADIKGISRRYKAPVLTIQGIEDHHVPGGISLLRKRTNATAVTAIKQHQSRDTLLLRLFNLTHDPVRETLLFGLPVRRVWHTSALEERTNEIPISTTNQVDLDLGGHEILTLEVDFDRAVSARPRK